MTLFCQKNLSCTTEEADLHINERVDKLKKKDAHKSLKRDGDQLLKGEEDQPLKGEGHQLLLKGEGGSAAPKRRKESALLKEKR